LELKHQEEKARHAKLINKVTYVDSNDTQLSIQNNENDDDESSQDSDSDSGDNDDNNGIENTSKSKKVPKKLTTAQRNKKRLRNIQSFEQSKIDSEKSVLEEIEKMIPAITKEIEKEEKTRQLNAELRKLNKSKGVDTTAMSLRDVSYVPLSDELHGSLRAVKPKGSIIYEHVASMETSGELGKKNTRKRRKTEKPHAEMKVKWHAKYKY
jgi:nucleolar protein 53